MTDQIYNKGRVTLICTELIFERLFKKLLRQVTFTLGSCFFKQIGGCRMGVPLQ